MLPRARKPPFAPRVAPRDLARLNRWHPLAEGLKFWSHALAPGKVRNLVTEQYGTVATGTVGYAETHLGPAAVVSSCKVDFATRGVAANTPDLTLATLFRWAGTAGSWQTPVGFGSTLGFYIPEGAGDPAGVDSDASSTSSFSAISVPSGEFHLYALDATMGAAPAGYKNGRFVQNGDTVTSWATAVNAVANLGDAQGGEFGFGDVLWGAMWNRRLSAAEHHLLWDTWHHLYVPVERRTYLIPAAAPSEPSYEQVSFRLYNDDGLGGLGEHA